MRLKNKVIQAFNKLASSYEREAETANVYNNYYERPAMINLLPNHIQGARVLDAGCAAGWYTEYFLGQGAQPVAVDMSPLMVEAAKRKVQGKAEVYLLDLSEALPFETESFDLILSSLTLHYLENWDVAFREFHRILKPGGLFLFSTHHPFMDVSMSEAQDYFRKELLVDDWHREGQTIEVYFYRRSMQEIVNSTAQFFQINQIIEPQPAKEMKALQPKAYDYLMKNPHFLILSARKAH